MSGILWELCPIWLLPAGIIWILLNVLCVHYHLAERLSKRYGWRKDKVEKWQDRITTVVSLVVSAIIILIVSKVINYDLLDSIWAGS